MNNNFLFNRFLQLTKLYKNYDLVSRIFELGGFSNVSVGKMKRWSKINPENSSYQIMPDQAFASFVRGLLGYIRIQESQSITVFNFERDFIEDVIAMFFSYRDDKQAEGIEVFRFGIDNK